MVDLIFTLLVSFVLVVLFFNIFTFDQNMFKVGFTLLTFIPVFGHLFAIVSFIWASIWVVTSSKYDYERGSGLRIYLRNNKLSHWLFNKTDEYFFTNTSNKENDEH